MFDFIRGMFGKGKIRAEVAFDDGSFTAIKVPYIGDIDELDATEFRDEVRRHMLVNYGKRVTDVTIIGWS